MRLLDASLNGRRNGSADAEEPILADIPMAGLAEPEVETVAGRIVSRAAASSYDGVRRHWPRRGIRQYLARHEGRGYWDFFRPSEHFYVSVTDAAYREHTWVRIEGERYFKIRVLLSGQLLDAHGDCLLKAPQAVAFLAPAAGRDGYFIARDLDTKMVVLHCQPQVLAEALELRPADLPVPFDSFCARERPACLHRIALSPAVFRAAQRIIESRRELPDCLRGPFLEAMGLDMLCQVLADLSHRQGARQAASRLSSRDLKSIYDARDHLSQHFAAPPSIPQLARIVGVNQTKLKAGFKQTIGMTIYDYVIRRRMERAAELLIARNCTIAEIAYMVGYDHPANFTCTFKKYYACLPRTWKQPRHGDNHPEPDPSSVAAPRADAG